MRGTSPDVIREWNIPFISSAACKKGTFDVSQKGAVFSVDDSGSSPLWANVDATSHRRQTTIKWWSCSRPKTTLLLFRTFKATLKSTIDRNMVDLMRSSLLISWNPTNVKVELFCYWWVGGKYRKPQNSHSLPQERIASLHVRLRYFQSPSWHEDHPALSSSRSLSASHWVANRKHPSPHQKSLLVHNTTLLKRSQIWCSPECCHKLSHHLAQASILGSLDTVIKMPKNKKIYDLQVDNPHVFIPFSSRLRQAGNTPNHCLCGAPTFWVIH